MWDGDKDKKKLVRLKKPRLGGRGREVSGTAEGPSWALCEAAVYVYTTSDSRKRCGVQIYVRFVSGVNTCNASRHIPDLDAKALRAPRPAPAGWGGWDCGWLCSVGDNREERVLAQGDVRDHAGDAEHGSATVVALHVELEGLDLRVLVAHPLDWEVLDHITRRQIRVLAEDSDVERGNEADDLQPTGERGGEVGTIQGARLRAVRQVLRDGHVAREAEASLRDNDAKRGRHGDAAVLDLNLLVAAVRLRTAREEVERIEEAERRRHPNVSRRREATRRCHSNLLCGLSKEGLCCCHLRLGDFLALLWG
eukprot:scaffold3418_cov124-Isochrysis_galbana.AAC.14